MRLHDEVTSLRRELADMRRRLASLERREERRGAAPAEVTQAVRKAIAEASWRFQVEPWAIEGTGRKRDVSRARQWVMFEVRERHGFSYPDIGAAMGRDHTTIISGCHEERIRRAKRLPDMEDSAKIEAGRNAASTASCPNRNRDTLEVRSMADNGHYPDSGPKSNSEHPWNGVAE